ncbi:MAG: hypothetical protein QOE90_2011 [Thermoplasmata archaeon]|jgi:hypothetical protein|nr:hypothetical protein [Thermoplasmata archaeon]
MKATLLVIVSLAALTFVSVAAPGASAVGYCTTFTGSCDGYIVCIGTQTSYSHLTHCQTGVREPPCTCDPWPQPL